MLLSAGLFHFFVYFQLTKGTKIDVILTLSELEKGIVKAGGKLGAIKSKQKINTLIYGKMAT